MQSDDLTHHTNYLLKLLLLLIFAQKDLFLSVAERIDKVEHFAHSILGRRISFNDLDVLASACQLGHRISVLDHLEQAYLLGGIIELKMQCGLETASVSALPMELLLDLHELILDLSMHELILEISSIINRF